MTNIVLHLKNVIVNVLVYANAGFQVAYHSIVTQFYQSRKLSLFNYVYTVCQMELSFMIQGFLHSMYKLLIASSVYHDL